MGAFVLVSTLFVASGPATADKVGDLTQQAKNLQDQIDRKNAEAERLAERYNQARSEMARLDEQIGQVKAKLDAQDGQIGQLNDRLAKFAVQTYMYGDQDGGLTALLATDDGASSIAQRRGYSPVVLGTNVDVADQLKATRQDTDKLKAELAVKEAQQAKLAKALETSRQAAATASDDATKLLATTNASLRKAVAEEQARRKAAAEAAAAAEQARRTAELKAQREAAAVAAAAQAASARRTQTNTRTGAAAGAPAVSGGGESRPPVVDIPDFPAPSPGAATAIAVARQQMGKPYIFATAGPDTFDCSGLTQYAWRAAGVSMDHWTVAQYRSFPKVPVDQLQPGDLVFFDSDIGHVGLYIGGGMMIDAPFPGSTVRLASIWTRGLLDFGVRPG